MNTFKEAEEDIKSFNERMLRESEYALRSPDVSNSEKNWRNLAWNNCKKNLDNITEVTIMRIGASINQIIDQVKYAYKDNSIAYWNDFENHIKKYFRYADPIGIDINDLLFFKNKNPFSPEVCDSFKQIANARFGTNIPMEGVLEQSRKELDAAQLSNDEYTEAEALIRYKELSRDAGVSTNGINGYYLLNDDELYLNAQSIVGSKQL